MRKPTSGMTYWRAALSISLLFWLTAITEVNAMVSAALRTTGGEGEAVIQEAKKLEPGKTIEGELIAGGSNSYLLTLASGRLARIALNLQENDAVVALYGPDGKSVSLEDVQNRGDGSQEISVVVETSGEYKLELRRSEKQGRSLRYHITLEELPIATTQDRDRQTARRALNSGIKLREKGTPDSLREAIAAFQKALALSRAAGDIPEEIDALRNLGDATSDTPDTRKALEYYNQSLALALANKDESREARALANIAGVHYESQELQKALNYYNQALPLLSELKEQKREAFVLNQIGQTYIQIRGPDQRKAFDYYFRALEIYSSLGDKKNEADVAENIGILYDFFIEPRKALDYFERELSLLQILGDKAGEGTAMFYIARAHQTRGEHQAALDYFLKALSLARESNDKEIQMAALQGIGWSYHALGAPETAIEYFEQASRLNQEDQVNQAFTLYYLGLIHESLGQKQTALACLEKSLEILHTNDRRRDQMQVLDAIGVIYQDRKAYEKALDYFNRALSVARASGEHSAETRILCHLGELHNLRGESQKALDNYTQALSLAKNAVDRKLKALALYGMGITQRQLGNLSEARKDVESALDVLESIRDAITHADLRLSYLATEQPYYETEIALLMRLHQQMSTKRFDALALQFSERARARSLLELLAKTGTDIRQGVDARLLEKEHRLLEAIDTRTQRQSALFGTSQSSDEKLTSLEKELTELLTEYRAVEAQIQATSPRYAALTQPRPLSLEEIQREVLDPGTLLLEYALGDERSYVWAVTNDSAWSYELPKREEIEKTAKRFYDLTANNQKPSPSGNTKSAGPPTADYNQTAAELSRMLLGPVAAHLGHKRLVIVGDGALNYLPFAALPVPTEQNLKRKSNPGDCGLPIGYCPLILEHEIVNAPSASAIAVLRHDLSGRKPAPKVAAVLADPVFEPNDDRVLAPGKTQVTPSTTNENATAATTSSDSFVRSQLLRSARQVGLGTTFPRLPFTRQEALAISSVARQGDVLQALDFKANRETASGEELSQYRIVHFATHGLLNNEHPELSGLVLSLVDEQGKPQNGFFRLLDIYNLKLGAELVVLSACRTAMGKQVGGEGLVGITRGFMYAGAPRVMASLWNIDDEATAMLMREFYKGTIGLGERPAAALRAAQISMLRQRRWNRPFYWAGFVLQGEWR